MTDREKKLAFLLADSPHFLLAGGASTYERAAKDLIANGVTFATDNNVGCKWIPVTERLPENDDVCLCFDRRMMAVLQWDERAERWVDYRRSYPKTSVTHWMPLPQPPKEVE